jgi:hypothetical protein
MIGGAIPANQEWFFGPEYTLTSEGVPTITYTAPSHEKIIVLSRVRVGYQMTSDEINNLDAPTHGFIVWLERQ